MVPTEMEDGLCLLDVIGDPNLLNEFLETEGETGSTGHSQSLSTAQSEGQTTSTSDQFHLNGSLDSLGSNGGFLTPSTTPTPSNQRNDLANFVTSQTIHHQSISRPNSRNGSPVIQGSSHLVNSLPSNHIQYTIQGRRSASPATGQQYALPSSPLLSRTRTPSQSPVPTRSNSGSPMFSQGLSNNQQIINSVKVSQSITPPTQQSTSISSSTQGVNINAFQLQAPMQPSLSVANTMQIQGIIQTQASGAQSQFTGQSNQPFIQQKTVLQTHPNLVQPQQQQQVIHPQQTQTVLQNIQNQNLLQAIQQNPSLLQTVTYTTGGVSSSQSVKSSSPGVNLYSTVQGSVQNPVGLQGTIIQTAQGKRILIPNQLSSGQPITVTGLQNLQPLTVRPSVNLQQQATINSVQAPASNAVGQPQISVLNINPQGQQIVIQRAGQPQNIIVRALQPNFIQLQAGQTSQITTSQSPIISQLPQNNQIINSHSQGNIPLQPLLQSNQGQQINLLNQAGLQVAPQGTVTLNIGNQNVNLSQVGSTGTFQPTQLQANPHRTNQSSQQSTLPVITQQSIQSSSNQQANNTSKSNKKGNKKTPAKVQQIAAANQPIQMIRPVNQTVLTAQSGHTGQHILQPSVSQIQSSMNIVSGNEILSNKNQSGIVVNPLQTTGTVPYSVSYSTANTTPVTTTVTHSSGPVITHVSSANTTYSAPLSSSSITSSQVSSGNTSSPVNFPRDHSQPANSSNQFSSQPVINNPAQANASEKNQQSVQTIQLSPQEHQMLQRIQEEVKALLEHKPVAPQQASKIQNLLIQHRQILNKGKLQARSAQIKAGQPAHIGGSQLIMSQAPTDSASSLKPGQTLISGSLPQVVGTNQTVVKLDMKSGSLVQSQLLNSKGVGNQVLVPAVPTNAPPGKLPISASPAVPTQLKIGTHVVTLNLTPQHRDKLISQLAKMSPEQQQLFYKNQYATIQRLQQQHQIQQQVQAAQLRKQAKALDGKLPNIIQALDKAGHIKSTEVVSPGRATKRPAGGEIPKASQLHQQLTRDQEKALNPDSKLPFKSVKEACQRLLRYHVFQSPGPSTKEFNKVDKMFDNISQELLRKRDQMFAKYQFLLLEESMREKSTAEMVMIERLMTQDLTDLIEHEKKQVDDEPESFEPMPAKYLKMSPKIKAEPVDCETSPSEGVLKREVSDSETPLDVEHSSSPEHPLTSTKSPVHSVMSSSGGFKLVIRKTETLNRTPKSQTVNTSPKELPNDLGDNVNQVEMLDESKTDTDSKFSANNSLMSNIKIEPVFQFSRSESVQEVPELPFKTFSGENRDLFFEDSSPAPVDSGINVPVDCQSSNTPVTIQDRSSPLVEHSAVDSIPSNVSMESMEDSVHPAKSNEKRSRTNSETDAALEGLLSCSNTDNLDGYQFDPDDFKAVGNPSDVTVDQFDISDPFDDNGDFFGYESHYDTQNCASENTDQKLNGPEQSYGLGGQYEAISPVSDRSGGFTEDMSNSMSAHQNYSSFFSAQTSPVNRVQSSHSMFSETSPGENDSNEVECAVDSIMGFGGSGDQPYSPVIGLQGRAESNPRNQPVEKTREQGKSRSSKTGGNYQLNGAGDHLGQQANYLFHMEDTDNTNNSNPVLKEQMESAINSILSPASSEHPSSPFPLEDYHFNDYESYGSEEVNVKTELPATDSGHQTGVDDDLDAAINSILM